MKKRFAIPGEQIKELVRPMGGCFMTDRITIDGLKIGYMYREKPDRPEDSGWRFFSGDESQEYIDDLTPGERALALLRRDHIRSDRLGLVCQQVFFGFHKSREEFLRAVLEANPHRQVQALACLSLAQYLDDRRNRLDVLRDQDSPETLERYYRVFGKDYIEELQRQDRGAVAREIETLFARAADQYSDVEIPVTYSGGTVGKKAEAELFKIRHLAVGKEAPEIEGGDQDGKQFKLSDYRGKVVLLDIWHHL